MAFEIMIQDQSGNITHHQFEDGVFRHDLILEGLPVVRSTSLKTDVLIDKKKYMLDNQNPNLTLGDTGITIWHGDRGDLFHQPDGVASRKVAFAL